MNINIYYGGRGLIDDPMLYVIDKLTQVLEEIRVNVTRYNLYEDKNSIAMLPKTLKEADGVIFAASVEWLGIGGYMSQFLDACWLYADKEIISNIYMMPVVTATTVGEKEAKLTLERAWDILGGKLCEGFSAYVEDHVEFETNTEYATYIEKKAEGLYRVIKQKIKTLPASDSIIKQNIHHAAIDLTPQESEQLSVYVSDDSYVKKQKEDIEELAQMFKGLMSNSDQPRSPEFVSEFTKAFHPMDGVIASYEIHMTDTNKTLIVDVISDKLNCYYGMKDGANVSVKTTRDVVNSLVSGRITFQRAFMSGSLTAKGNFQTIKIFDDLFQF